MFTAETAQSMYDFRADDVIGNAAGRPILLLHSSVDLVTPTEQSIEMFKRARSRAICICSPRPTTSCSRRATRAFAA